ncbi:MAG: endonuclease/exonuclease/phosphatase family protein [Marinosulfonomonas sp.]|nr:endonuclease/exonuclease/phosphatase family protein [Marinosulfonomonas sp.]
MRRLIAIVFVICLLLIVASFGGALHGIGDSLAVFRYLIAMGVAVTAALLQRRRGLRIAGVVLVAAGIWLMPEAARLVASDPLPETSYALYQKNLLYYGDQRRELVADILAVDADFVTLQELYSRNTVVFERLQSHYQTHQICGSQKAPGEVVFSKWPAVPGQVVCDGRIGVAGLQVETPHGRVWVLSLHLRWPYPYRQPEQVKALLPVLKGLEGPIIIAGDFNMVPWSYSVRAIERASGSKRAGAMVRTLVHASGLLQVPIDHVLVPGGQGALQVRPLFGSDHLGVLLGFEL